MILPAKNTPWLFPERGKYFSENETKYTRVSPEIPDGRIYANVYLLISGDATLRHVILPGQNVSQVVSLLMIKGQMQE